MFTGDIFGDDVRWKKGYIVIIQTVGPHFCIIMSLHAFYPQLIPIIYVGV